MKNLQVDPKEVSEFFSQFKVVKTEEVKVVSKPPYPNHKKACAKWRGKNKLHLAEYNKPYQKNNREAINANARKRYLNKKLDANVKDKVSLV